MSTRGACDAMPQWTGMRGTEETATPSDVRVHSDQLASSCLSGFRIRTQSILPERFRQAAVAAGDESTGSGAV